MLRTSKSGRFSSRQLAIRTDCVQARGKSGPGWPASKALLKKCSCRCKRTLFSSPTSCPSLAKYSSLSLASLKFAASALRSQSRGSKTSFSKANAGCSSKSSNSANKCSPKVTLALGGSSAKRTASETLKRSRPKSTPMRRCWASGAMPETCRKAPVASAGTRAPRCGYASAPIRATAGAACACTANPAPAPAAAALRMSTMLSA
mmetsp:Transcript_45511/g.130486  ORF Transcript_45511/g.130486 Transcript_45511/m.130486 type:complete len:205 (+) Transcript_45511:1511-2125(+)